MSDRRRRSESLWNRKEAENEIIELNSNDDDDSPKRSNSEINDVFMSDDFSMQGNENMLMDNDNIRDKHRMKIDHAFDDWDGQYSQPYRGSSRAAGGKDRARSRSRSWSPNPNRDRDQDRTHSRDLDGARPRDWDRDRAQGLARSRSRSRSRGREQGRAMSPSRGGGLNRLDDDSTQKWSNNRSEYEHTDGSQYHRNHKGGYTDQDHRRQSNQNMKTPCKFFMMGRCKRDNCRFSHDVPNSNPNLDDKNNQDLDNKQEARFIPNNSVNADITLNRNEPTNQLNGSVNEGEKSLEASRNDKPQASSVQISQNPKLGNPQGLINSGGLVNSTVVNGPVQASAPTEKQKSTEVSEVKTAEKPKADEGNIGNDEKAMRAFKNALVEFVKDILKPKWKEGKMSREVHKTIVKKVVEKVTSTVQGAQIPRTQEKTDQYLTFSKPKITKLVEAYVGRLVKA